MRNLIDTIFSPVVTFLGSISDSLRSLSVPVARPLDFGKYLGHFAFLGPAWITFITTVCTLGFIYFLIFFVMSNIGLFRKFKDMIKWW
ncbi:hypothetical protein DQX05_13790 [Paenibacillus thiaminolyticus]|uniref:Uncharacterized protein n=1 Tax=Paenibacillus thiaminolyticus TaxID=49283 RepID=A0A3A3GGF5_PANTH|nr:hypothetical protein DQX05_13700 [Paenibacillus thiaminolyticus]RJG23315.1 hypothetical protein DQX05_13790 [Paenibacillus thiaminolyticus]